MIFLTGPPLNLLSVGWNVTDFKKTLESQTGPHFFEIPRTQGSFE